MINKTLLIWDYGSFIHTAIELSKHFSVVKYHCVHSGAYPSSAPAWVGKGIPEIVWVDDFFEEVNSADLIFFPDCRDAGLQTYLRSMGKLVFGSGYGIDLENNRWETNEILKSVDLPAVKMEVVMGINALREFLQKNEDIYVKSNFRGDMESFHSENYKLIEPKLDDLEKELGILKHNYEFICCFPIDGDDVVEIGTDSFNIDGKTPSNLLYGIEVKDLGYIGLVKPKEECSPLLTEPLEKLAPVFADYFYRNFFSTEIRVGKDKKPYVTDFTCRCPSPPSELYFSMIENIGEIMLMGAQGILVEPKYKYKFGVQANITSEWAEQHWQPIYFSPAIRDYVKIKNYTIIDDVHYYIPINGVEMVEIGAVVGYGNTLDEAIKNLNKYADQVQGFKICINTGSMEKAKGIIDQCEKLGIKFK